MKKLRAYLSSNQISQAAFALRIGVTQAAVSKYCSGQTQPSLAAACMIERETGGAVPAADWVDLSAARAREGVSQ